MRDGTVRDNKALRVLECTQCGLVFLSSFDHIRTDLYANSGMHSEQGNLSDWLRETARDDERRVNYLRSQIENRSVLDFGCGAGGFLLRAREYARNVAGVEVENANRRFFEDSQLNVSASLDEVSGTYDVITLFHVLEHLPDPRAELTKISQKLNDGGRIIIEVPNANDALLTLYKNKEFSNFTYWSLHLFLFTNATLAELCKQAVLSVDYVRQIQRYPLSNHLYWLSQGKPGGHKAWIHLDSPELNRYYEMQLANIGSCDTIIASLRKNKG